MLNALDIVKRYGARRVLERATLRAERGVVAVVGANGSGKSTLLRILSGAERADSGTVSVCGQDLDTEPLAARRRLAYVPSEPTAYPFLSGREFLRFVASTRHATVDKAALEAVAEYRLSSHLDVRFDAMSLGTQRKFFLVAALQARPDVLILDEPTSALDGDALAALESELLRDPPGRLVLLTSHDHDFVARVAHERLVLSEGRVGLG